VTASELPWRSIVFNAIAACALAAVLTGLILIPRWDWSHSTAGLIVAFFAGLIGNFEHIESFIANTSGFQVRTREVVRKAEVAIKELHELAAGIGTVLVGLVVGQGRTNGNQHSLQNGQSHERDVRKAEIMELLRRLGLPNELVDRVDRSDRQYVLVDYRVVILYRASKRLKLEDQPDWTSFSLKWLDMANQPVPKDLRVYLAAKDLIDPQIEQFLQDYEHYWNTNLHRRPEVWRDRGTWIQPSY
jgi:hypothetical protein